MTGDDPSGDVEDLLDRMGVEIDVDPDSGAGTVPAGGGGTTANVRTTRRDANHATIAAGLTERPFLRALGLVRDNPPLLATGGVLGLLVWGLTIAGTYGSVAITPPVVVGALVAASTLLTGAYGAASAAVFAAGSTTKAYLLALRHRHVLAIGATVLSNLLVAVGIGAALGVRYTTGLDGVALGGAVVGVAVVVGLLATPLQFVDVRVTLSNGLLDAVRWNVGHTLDLAAGAAYAIVRVLVLVGWLWLPVEWLTATGYPGHSQAALFLVGSVAVGTVLPVWHLCVYRQLVDRHDLDPR